MASPITVDQASLHGLANKTVIITGGASGIGLEAARLFYSLGSKVVVADVNGPREEPEFLVSDRVVFITCDITRWSSLLDVFHTAQLKFGAVDIVCANAGINEVGDQFFDLQLGSDGRPQEPDQRTVDVNLKGTINTVALAIYSMSAHGGSIILTSSLGGYLGVPKMPLYVASKHGVVGLMRSLQRTARSKNIAISVVAPNMTPTPILASLPGVSLGPTPSGAELEQLYSSIRASGTPANSTAVVAQAMAYLASRGLSSAGQGLLVSADVIYDIERSVLDAWPEYFRDAAGYILASSGGAVYEQN